MRCQCRWRTCVSTKTCLKYSNKNRFVTKARQRMGSADPHINKSKQRKLHWQAKCSPCPQFTEQPTIPNDFPSPITSAMHAASMKRTPCTVIPVKTKDQESPRPRWCLTLLSKGLWWPTGSHLRTNRKEICVKFSLATNARVSPNGCMTGTMTTSLFPSQRWSQISLKN